MGSAQGGMTNVITVQILVFAFMFLMIWLIAFRRQNWARWVFVALFVIGLPGYLAVLKNLLGITLQGGLSLAQVCIQITALYFIFTGNAVGWFRRPAEPLAS